MLVRKGVFGKVNNKSTLYRAGEKLYKYCTIKTQKYQIYLIKTTLCTASINTIPTYNYLQISWLKKFSHNYGRDAREKIRNPLIMRPIFAINTQKNMTAF